MTLAEYVEQVHSDLADIGCKLTCGKDCHTVAQEIVAKAIQNTFEEYEEDGWYEFEPGRYIWNEMAANP